MKSVNRLTKKPLIGFIGQGFVGKNYADDFENRGYKVIRYAQEPSYIKNKDLIKECDVVFIAVPTPTTHKGFDSSILESTMKLIGKGKIAIIKSTVIPGTTRRIQGKYKNIIITHSPEFLSEKTAAEEAANPPRNIVGIVKSDKKNNDAAKLVLSILPKAPYELICSAEDAEIIKYSHNTLGYIKIIFTNLIYDLTKSLNGNWDSVRDAIIADPYVANSAYMNPVHKTGRGAGGRCFIKDFSAFRESYENILPHDKQGIALLKAFEAKNIDLLRSTNKDLDILAEVYKVK